MSNVDRLPVLPEEPAGTWVLTTATSARIYIDFDDGLWRREPRPNRHGQRLGLHFGRWHTLTVGPVPVADRHTPLPGPVSVGRRCLFGIDMDRAYVSSPIVDIRPCLDLDAPPPNPVLITELRASITGEVSRTYGDHNGLRLPNLTSTTARSWWRASAGDTHTNDGYGATPMAALKDLADHIEAWIAARPHSDTAAATITATAAAGRFGGWVESSRTRRWWAARAEQTGSVRGHLLAHAPLDAPSTPDCDEGGE